MSLGQILLKIANMSAAAPGIAAVQPMVSTQAAVEQSKAKNPGFTPLTQATKVAMLDELRELGFHALVKIAAAPSTEEAIGAAQRLKKLESNRPGVGELGRGALAGAAVGPVANLAWRAIAGKKGWAGTGNLWPGARPILATAGHGAVIGSAMPAVKHTLESNVEKEKIREYLGQSDSGKLRSGIKKTVGV